eukprot:Gb_10610 [translate_table: standard]
MDNSKSRMWSRSSWALEILLGAELCNLVRIFCRPGKLDGSSVLEVHSRQDNKQAAGSVAGSRLWPFIPPGFSPKAAQCRLTIMFSTGQAKDWYKLIVLSFACGNIADLVLNH